MNKIHRTSKFFRMIFSLALVVMPIMMMIGWYYAPTPISIGHNTGFFINVIPKGVTVMHQLSAFTKFSAFAVSCIPLAINLFICYMLIRLFRQFESNQLFTISNVRYIKRIGIGLLIGQLIQPFYQAAVSGILTIGNPAGHRIMIATFDGTNIGIILMAFLIILISWIISEGYKIKQENSLTI